MEDKGEIFSLPKVKLCGIITELGFVIIFGKYHYLWHPLVKIMDTTVVETSTQQFS